MSGGTSSASPADRQAAAWLASLEAALGRGDAVGAAGLLEPDGFWRDLVAFTWNLHTSEGGEAIAAMLGATVPAAAPRAFHLLGPATTADGVTEAWFGFETASGRGKGHLRLRDGRAWTVLTTLQALTGHEERCGPTREPGVEHGVARHRRNWLERRTEETESLGRTREPWCLIIGGGQAGLSLAARLRRLGVPALVVERNARVGDNWRRRYRSLCLHDPVWYDHLPYLPFPDHWPVFTPKDKLGDWLEAYARLMELDVWTGTTCRQARQDPAAGTWEVTVERAGETVVLRPRHLVLATGMSGKPQIPDIPGAGSFRGTVHHSSAHEGGRGHAGERCVIVGANNSAHDIAAELWEWDADVTMIQRSPTIVVRSETLSELVWGRLYSEAALEAGITTEVADLTLASVPFRLMPERQAPIYEEIRRRDAALYRGLEAAGFRCHFGEDGAGLHAAYLRRGSGYYIDVGASDLVVEGRIGVRSLVEVARINERSVTLTDGSELPADLIVHATGYGSMTGWAEELISAEVADRVGRCWGLGSDTRHDPGPWEGELRNLWKPTHQPGLWFHGGNLMQCRHYSRYLALQLKARHAGLPTPVYGLAPVHHRR